jgi:hypothetical protein
VVLSFCILSCSCTRPDDDLYWRSKLVADNKHSHKSDFFVTETIVKNFTKVADREMKGTWIFLRPVFLYFDDLKKNNFQLNLLLGRARVRHFCPKGSKVQ